MTTPTWQLKQSSCSCHAPPDCGKSSRFDLPWFFHAPGGGWSRVRIDIETAMELVREFGEKPAERKTLVELLEGK